MTEYPALALLGDIMRDAAPDDRSIFTPERIRFVMELMPGAPPQIADIRARLTALTGSSQFRLEPLFGDGGDPSFLVFSPDGIDRTLPDDAMFAIAEALRDRLGLLSCEPDIGAAASSDPSDQPLRGTEGVIGDIFCWAQGKAPDDKEWALRKTQVLEAWARSPGRGQGITIAQPDTGIVDHIELGETTIDHSRTLNLIEGGTDPTDPLSSRMSNPGHGTATASVVPLPVNGSSTAPPTGQPARMHVSANSGGIVAKWAPLYGLVVTVQTLRRLRLAYVALPGRTPAMEAVGIRFWSTVLRAFRLSSGYMLGSATAAAS